MREDELYRLLFGDIGTGTLSFSHGVVNSDRNRENRHDYKRKAGLVEQVAHTYLAHYQPKPSNIHGLDLLGPTRGHLRDIVDGGEQAFVIKQARGLGFTAECLIAAMMHMYAKGGFRFAYQLFDQHCQGEKKVFGFDRSSPLPAFSQ